MATLVARITLFIQQVGPDVKTLLARALPAGGSAGQMLAKNSATNYDAAWVNAPSGGFTAISASATTGSVTIACGTNTNCFCSLTTTGSITTLNVTGTVTAYVRLRITLGGAHSLTNFQYNGSATNVKWAGGVTGSFITTSGSVFEIDLFADGTLLVVDAYTLR